MKTKSIKNVVFDVDGVFTNGSFLYDESGKKYKMFGAHDSDGLKLLKKKGFEVFAISADLRGFKITKRRFDDMKCVLYQVSEDERYSFIKKKVGLSTTAFIGDGVWDGRLLKECSLGLVPKNATNFAKSCSDIILSKSGGEGAVLDAAEQIIKLLYGENAWKDLLMEG